MSMNRMLKTTLVTLAASAALLTAAPSYAGRAWCPPPVVHRHVVPVKKVVVVPHDRYWQQRHATRHDARHDLRRDIRWDRRDDRRDWRDDRRDGRRDWRDDRRDDRRDHRRG